MWRQFLFIAEVPAVALKYDFADDAVETDGSIVESDT